MPKYDWKKTKTIYWSDENNDDFDEVGLKRPPVPKGYHYKRTNPINNFFSDWFYFGFAIPLIHIGMLVHGIKVKGRENLKEVRHKGVFIYSNHVALSDVTKFQTRVFRFRRVNILGYSDTLSMPVVRNLCRALGYLPLPLKGDLDNMIALNEAYRFYIQDKKQAVLIFPEAHIWPYYTKIRTFRAGSFNYPATLKAPILPVVTTWRKVWYSKKPKQTLYILPAIYPKEEYTQAENKQYLYDECLKAMKEKSEAIKQYEYIKYIKKDEKDA